MKSRSRDLMGLRHQGQPLSGERNRLNANHFDFGIFNSRKWTFIQPFA